MKWSQPPFRNLLRWIRQHAACRRKLEKRIKKCRFQELAHALITGDTSLLDFFIFFFLLRSLCLQLNTNRINNRICRKEAWTSITRCLHLCAQCVDLQAIGINLKVSTVVSSISFLCAFAFLVVLIKTYAGGAAGLIRSLWDKFCPSREQPCAILNLTVPDIFFLRAVHRSRSLAPVFFSRLFIFSFFYFLSAF